MLDPSSSEDTGGESEPEVVPHKSASCSALKRSDSGGAAGRQQPAAPGGARGRRATGGGEEEQQEEEQEEQEEDRKERERIQEEQERRMKLQLYVFVMRCIAYPFNAKQPTDMARRQQKVSRHLEPPAEPEPALTKRVWQVSCRNQNLRPRKDQSQRGQRGRALLSSAAFSTRACTSVTRPASSISDASLFNL